MAASNTGHPYNAKQDSNDFPSLTAVSGTAGTADVNGTAEQIRVGANPTTGALYVQDLAGGAGTTNVQGSVQLTGGTLNLGTVTLTDAGTNVNLVTGTITTGSLTNIANLHNGTVVSPSGTITTGSLTNVAGLHSGTVNVGTFVMPTGTVTTGSLSNVAMVNAGTVVVTLGTVVGPTASGGSISSNPLQMGGTDATGTIRAVLVDANGHQQVDIQTGTLLSAGTTTGVGVVSNLTNGSVNILTGTIQSSGTTTGVGVVTSVTNLAAGTLLNSGTTTGVGVVTSVTNIVAGTLLNSGTTTGVGVVSALTNGSVNILTGTVTSVTNLVDGTIHLDHNPVRLGTPFTTYGTTGAAVWGTIIAASGAGTKQYVSSLDIVVHSGTVDVAVTNIGVGGSTGAGVLARGAFPAGGGIAREFSPVIASGTNGTLSYWLGGAGTVSIDVVYWQGV